MPLWICSMTQQHSPIVSDPRKQQISQRTGILKTRYWKKTQGSEIKAAEKVQKIRHCGELQQTGKNERWQQAANMCGCACTQEWLLWATLSFYSCTDTTFYTLQQTQKEAWLSTQGCQTALAKKHNGSNNSKVWRWDTVSGTNGSTLKIHCYVQSSSYV